MCFKEHSLNKKSSIIDSDAYRGISGKNQRWLREGKEGVNAEIPAAQSKI